MTESFEKVTGIKPDVAATIVEVRRIDPDLLEYSEETRKLVGLGAELGQEVTENYGTPNEPKWASGTYEEEVFMGYHNGGFDGHTSVGPKGAGVPRNVLLIAQAVNRSAGKEIYDPQMRAVGFYAAEAHDRHQLCGRTLLPEGQGINRGDERLSAEDARERYMATGGDPETGNQIYNGVMATAFNPETSAQNVLYEQWRKNPNDPELIRGVLGQELVAAADLLGPAQPRGPLGAIEYSVELLCLKQKSQIVQERLRSMGVHLKEIGDMEQLFKYIGEDEVLRLAFSDVVSGQAKFFSDFLHYSDEAIKAACGKGIDDMFPGRVPNAAFLGKFSESLKSGRKDPLAIWLEAHDLVNAVSDPRS